MSNIVQYWKFYLNLENMGFYATKNLCLHFWKLDLNRPCLLIYYTCIVIYNKISILYKLTTKKIIVRNEYLKFQCIKIKIKNIFFG